MQGNLESKSWIDRYLTSSGSSSVGKSWSMSRLVPNLIRADPLDLARDRLFTNEIGRAVDDQLPCSFTCDPSEAEWLTTLLTTEELRYIFEGGSAF